MLIKRGTKWHINTTINVGKKSAKIRETTGTSDKKIAGEILNQRIAEVTQELLYGKQGTWTIEDGCVKYLQQRKTHQLKDAIYHTDFLMEYLGEIPMRLIHIDHPLVQELISDCADKGNKASTINHHLKVLRNILNNAARKWRDEEGNPWLLTAPLITMLQTDPTKGHALKIGEETELFRRLSERLALACRFVLNTGLRNSAVVQLRWEWEVAIPELGITVFDVPARYMGERVKGTKNHQDHRVVLNSVAYEIIETVRGRHPEFVFSHARRGLERPYGISEGLYTTAWRNAVEGAGLKHCRGQDQHFRIHDFKHTFGARLRAMDVTKEDRMDLLGHKNESITTHYSPAEVEKLLAASEKVVQWYERKPKLRLTGADTNRTQSELGKTGAA